MGNDNDNNNLMMEHEERMRNIRNQYDLKNRQLLEKEKALEEEHKKWKEELKNLTKIDKYHYNNKLKKIEEEKMQNDLLAQREKKRIEDKYKYDLNVLSEKQLKINNDYYENIMNEKKRYDSENNRIRLNFEKRHLENKNKFLDIKTKAEEEGERDRQNFENNYINSEFHLQNKFKEINMKREQDINNHLNNMEAINNNHIEELNRINNDYINKRRQLEEERLRRLYE